MAISPGGGLDRIDYYDSLYDKRIDYYENFPPARRRAGPPANAWRRGRARVSASYEYYVYIADSAFTRSRDRRHVGSLDPHTYVRLYVVA
eukprot:COSAG02_NODE_3068_length_7430_cov_2.999864_6_plen_90_part_00